MASLAYGNKILGQVIAMTASNPSSGIFLITKIPACTISTTKAVCLPILEVTVI